MNLIQRFGLLLTGKVFMGNRKLSGWKDNLPFYAFRCPKHGIVEDYPHGYNDRLDCPECIKEKTKK